MKMLILSAGLTALTLGAAAQAAPVPVQTGIVASEGVVTQVRERSMEHGNMRGMGRGSRMGGMGHGGRMGGMSHGNMRGMRRGGMGHGNMRGMNHGM